jgi:hypothetical protein
MNVAAKNFSLPATLPLRLTSFISRLRVKVMIDSTKEKTERAKALRKLIKQWRTKQETKNKAELLLSRNPELKENPAQKQNSAQKQNAAPRSQPLLK